MEEDRFWSVFLPRHRSGLGSMVENVVCSQMMAWGGIIQFEAYRDYKA